MKSGVFFTSELKPLFLKLTFVSKSSCLRGILTALTSSRKVYIPKNTGGCPRHGEAVYRNARPQPSVSRSRTGTKKAPEHFCLGASSKTATTYSPTCTQYHRRGEA